MEHWRLTDINQGEWDIPALRRQLEEVLPQNTMFQDFILDRTFPGIGQRKIMLNARRLHQEPHKNRLILLAMEDITRREERATREP